ncbi:AGAP007948-PA-like protein [Anopheles sinensis]|uniref:AGAP007948-PA-like protein n=1 Tax=Anopheles sinensis TaxID=74873 RepID=A0A084VP01_ANOSI|nr:AGAP007948-PA-like protein [Anopheles sinensis]
MDAASNEDLRIKRVAGGYLVQYVPLFSLDGSLLFVIYESSIQAFSVTTGDLVRSYESRANESPLIGMVIDHTQGKYIYGCTRDGFIISWKIDSGLLIDRSEILKGKFVVESFHVLYDPNGVSSFLVLGTSTKKLFIQYCPRKKMVIEVIRPAIHENLKYKEKNGTPKENNDASTVQIVAAPGGSGLNFFAYIAKNRWYWVRLKPTVFVGSMPHCSGVEPVVLTCHPKEAIIAVGDTMGRVVLYRNFLADEKIIFETYHWHPHPVKCLAFSNNGTHFYSGGHERVLVKWSVGQEEKADLIPRLTDSILSIAIGPENAKLALCTADNGIQIMNALHKQTANVQSFSKISADVPGDELFPAGLQVNPRTHAIVMNARLGCIQFFSTHTKSLLHTLDITMRNYNTKEDRDVIHNTVVSNICVNAHWLATVENWNDNHNSTETRLKFWKYNESRQTYSLNTNLENVHQGAVYDIAFSSTTRERDLQCATAGQDRRIKVWSLEEVQTTNGGEKLVWACVGCVQHRNLPVRSIAYSQDASLLAGGFGNILCIWNPDTLKLKCVLSAPSGYDGCVNRALMIFPAVTSQKRAIDKKQNYHDIRTKIIAEIVAQTNGKGKSSLFDDVTEKYKKLQRSSRVNAIRNEIIESVSENNKKYIVQKIQKNSKLNMSQRAELFHALRITCRTNEEMKIRIQNKLLTSQRSAHKVEQYLQKICATMTNAVRFRAVRKQQHFLRRQLPSTLLRNGISNMFSQKNVNRTKTSEKEKNRLKDIINDKEKVIENPIRSFSQIQNVFFCYGQFSHLVVVNTENRLVVWNLLSLKIQVSAAITVDRIAFDPITNLIASFTKDKELYVFLPNIPMPLYHRSNMPQVFGAVWVPRRYPSSQSFNVDWQATSQLFFLNEKQELLHLVSDNDEDMLAPVDSDDEEILVADEGGNQSKTPFAAMLAKQVVGSNVQRISEVRSGNNIGVAGKSAVRDIVGSSSHTMAPVNLLCRDFLRSLLITEENRAKEGNSQDQQGETVNGRVRPFAKDRVGYLGDHFMLALESSECSESAVELFLKILPSGIPALTDYLHSIGTARKESHMYRELLPKLEQFSRFAPKCFLALEPAGKLLVLENLHGQGFRNIPNESAGIFDKEHLKCALIALAKFHSASLLLEQKTGESLTVLAPGVLEENAWVRKENNPRVQELDNAIDVLLALVRVIEKDNPQLMTILEKLPKFMQQIYELVKPSSEYRNVACHGDLWANNMMFRYAVVDGRSVPQESLIIDYQFTRYAPPAYDLNMLITLTTTGHFRRIHREELIRFYYQRVLEELKCHHSVCNSPSELLNEESFYKSCETYRISGLIDNFLMNHVTLLPRDYKL